MLGSIFFLFLKKTKLVYTYITDYKLGFVYFKMKRGRKGENMSKRERAKERWEEKWGYLYAKGVDYYYGRRNEYKLWDYLCTLNEEEVGLKEADVAEIYDLILKDYRGIL